MVRSLFPGHRRYSITHRAVQRLRELVPTQAEDDDEALRDRLDSAICRAEDDSLAVKTLDVMLGEPQILVPLESFGDTLYAIIKEDTVVTVLPKGHGEEILQRGQALQQKVAAGVVPPPQPEESTERWDVRRRWRREVAPPIIERVARSNGASQVGDEEAANESPETPTISPTTEALLTRAVEQATRRVRGRIRLVESPPQAPEPAASSPIAEALVRGLDRARHRAAVSALAEVLAEQEPESELLPLWNQLLEDGLPPSLTVADLLSAVRQISTP